MLQPPIQLDEPTLWRTDAFIDGRWIAPTDGQRFAVEDPATGKVIARVANLGTGEVQQAIDAAGRAFHAWRR